MFANQGRAGSGGASPHVNPRRICFGSAESTHDLAAARPAYFRDELLDKLSWEMASKALGTLYARVLCSTRLLTRIVAQGPEDGPIDVTPHIVAGTNTVRVIQLCDLRDRFFVLYVGYPSEEEKKKYTIVQNWDRWRASASASASPALL